MSRLQSAMVVPAGQVEVVVLRVQSDSPQGRNLEPRWFRYDDTVRPRPRRTLGGRALASATDSGRRSPE